MHNERAVVSSVAAQLSEWLAPLLNVRTDGDVAAAVVSGQSPGSTSSSAVAARMDALNTWLVELSSTVSGVKPSATPLISVQNLRVVYTSVEILWCWGLAASVRDHSKFELPPTTIPNAILVNQKVLSYGSGQLIRDIGAREMLRFANTIYWVVTVEGFSGLMLQRNLDRLLLTYMTLSSAAFVSDPGTETSVDASVAQEATTALNQLVCGPFASAVVTKLRGFTKGPAWLRDASLRILSSILTGLGGLEIVLSGYLEGAHPVLTVTTVRFSSR
jgi:hypothetical protein